MTFQTHPKWKYSKTGAVVVDDIEQEEALGEGWFDSPDALAQHLEDQAREIDEERRQRRANELADKDLDDAIKKLQGETDDTDDTDKSTEVSIEVLREKAKELGIEFHHRTGAATLEQLIKEKIEQNGE